MALGPIAGASTPINYGSDDVKQSSETGKIIVIKEDDLVNNSNNKPQKQENELEQDIIDAISKANEFLKQKKTRCEFSYVEKLNRVSITVYDTDTEKVLKEIPPEESLKAIEKIWEIAGLIVDEKR